MNKLLTALFCIFPYFVFAQGSTEKPAGVDARWQISVSGGEAIPVGKFGKKDVWDSTAVFANIGPVLEVAGSYRINQSWRITAIIAGQQHVVDAKAVARQMEAADGSPYDKYAYRSGKWQPVRLLAGAAWTWPIGESRRFSLNASALAGVLWGNVPQRSLLELSFDSSGMSFAEGEATYGRIREKWQFAYQAGVGAQYEFGRRYFLQANAEYAASLLHIPGRAMTMASHEYPPRPITFVSGSGTPPPVPVSPNPASYNQPMATVNLSLGTGIRI